MSDLKQTLHRAIGDVRALGHPWALVGGLAVSARVEPRLTRDVDLAIGVDDDAGAEAIVRTLMATGYEMVAGVEHEATGRLATVRLRPSFAQPGRTLLDLLFASSGIENEVAAGADDLEILSGFVVPVASVAHLLAMKILARDDRARPQDYDDIVALMGVADSDDLEHARTALRLIERRGYARGKNLERELDAMRLPG